MANDDLINKLAAQIKAKEDNAALSQQIQLHKSEFIKASCPQFFVALGRAIAESAEKLNRALEGSASAQPAITCQSGVANITLGKDDFPYVSAGLTLNPNALGVSFVLKWSPRKQSAISGQHHDGIWKFDVDESNTLLLSGYIAPNHPPLVPSEPQAVADFLFQTVFTVS